MRPSASKTPTAPDRSDAEHLHDRGTDRFLDAIAAAKPIHPADARVLRRLRALAVHELTELGMRREQGLSRLLRAAGVAVPAALFALAALVPADPTPIDGSLPSAGVHGSGAEVRPAQRQADAWAGFFWSC